MLAIRMRTLRNNLFFRIAISEQIVRITEGCCLQEDCCLQQAEGNIWARLRGYM